MGIQELRFQVSAHNNCIKQGVLQDPDTSRHKGSLRLHDVHLDLM